MRPALYTQGCVPWRHGFDAPRIEAYLEKARLQGLNQADFFDDPAIKGTLCVVRSSTLPSEARGAGATPPANWSASARSLRRRPASPSSRAHPRASATAPTRSLQRRRQSTSRSSTRRRQPPPTSSTSAASGGGATTSRPRSSSRSFARTVSAASACSAAARPRTPSTTSFATAESTSRGSPRFSTRRGQASPRTKPSTRSAISDLHASPPVGRDLRWRRGEDRRRRLRLGVAKEAGWYWMHDWGGPPAPYLQRGVYLRSSMTSAEKARAEAAVALLEADTFLAAVWINASLLLTIIDQGGGRRRGAGGWRRARRPRLRRRRRG